MDPETLVLTTPIVTGLVEVYKRGGLPTKLTGAASIVTGIAIAALVVADPTSTEAALTGITTGLAACGLYSQVVTMTTPKLPEPVA